MENGERVEFLEINKTNRLFRNNLKIVNKTMPAPKYEDTKEKLIENMRSTIGSGDRVFDIAKAILDIKSQEDVAEQTKKLTTATWILAFATSGLVIATIVLALS